MQISIKDFRRKKIFFVSLKFFKLKIFFLNIQIDQPVLFLFMLIWSLPPTIFFNILKFVFTPELVFLKEKKNQSIQEYKKKKKKKKNQINFLKFFGYINFLFLINFFFLLITFFFKNTRTCFSEGKLFFSQCSFKKRKFSLSFFSFLLFFFFEETNK